LPDTFASMAAAQADDNADASIGNVTGSNSVNVFLGLGLPWTIAALYWGGADDDSRAEWMKRYGRGKDSISFDFYKPDDDGDTGPSALPYVVPAGNLSVSVGIFCFCAAVALTTLSYRRSMYGAELGGPAGPAKATFGFFVSLWLFYVAMSAANEYGAFK